MQNFDQVLANIDHAERLCRERGLEGFAWTWEFREAVLEGRLPERIEQRGEPVVQVEGVRPLSSYAGFVNLRAEIVAAREKAKANAQHEEGRRAPERMRQIVRQADELVSQLLPLAEEATRVYRAWADWQQSQTYAGPVTVDRKGEVNAPISGPVEPGSRPREQISAADLVTAVLDPTVELLVFERVFPRGERHVTDFRVGQVEPEPDVVVSDELRAAYAQPSRMRRTPARLVPGIRVQEPTDDDGSTGEPEAS